eukprot:4256387-Prymnesium_polylepis.1
MPQLAVHAKRGRQLLEREAAGDLLEIIRDLVQQVAACEVVDVLLFLAEVEVEARRALGVVERVEHALKDLGAASQEEDRA